MTTDLDHAISSAISDLVAAAPEPLDTPSIATITGRPVSRRPRLLLATAASAAIIGGGLAVLAVARRHTSTDLTTATATDNTAAADGRGLDRLLYPAASSGDATAASISAPGGRAAGALISPTGNVYTVNVMENFWGSLPVDLEQRTIGTIDVAVGNQDGTLAYTALNRCTMIGIGNRSPESQPWSAEAFQLLGATTLTQTSASISVPAGWTSLGAGSLGTIYELHFDASSDVQGVVLWQMPGTPVGTLLSQFSPGAAIATTADGATAWLLRGTDGDPYNYLAWDAAGSAAMVGVPHGDEAQFQSVVSSLRAGHAAEWAKVLDSVPGATGADASAQEAESGTTVPGTRTDPSSSCGSRTLTITDTTLELVAADRPGPVHVVQAGETWASIAADEGLTVDLLLEFNGLTTAELALTGETVDTPLDAGTAVRLARVGSVTDTTVPTTP